MAGEERDPADSILVVDGFVSEVGCAEILDELDCALWRASLTYEMQPDRSYKDVLTDVRISDTAHQEWFSDELVERLVGVEAGLTERFGVDPVDLEWWQATRYGAGGRFDHHLDAGYWDDHYAGDRVRSFLVYLNTPAGGGGTYFRALDVSVEARAGRLLAWDNLFPDGRPDHRMIHSGTPVIEGTKTTLVTWQRQRRFRLTPTAATAMEEVGHP